MPRTLVSTSMCLLSPLWLLLVVVLLVTVLSVEARALRGVENGTNYQTHWGTAAEGTTLISHMCAAQCNAFCNENRGRCDELCRAKTVRTWIMKCQEQEREVIPAYYDSGDSFLTKNSECPGTCSNLKDQEEAGYFIPLIPDVVLVRDVTNGSVTLTWSVPNTLSDIVYVVQEKESNRWAEAHLVMGADHFTRYELDVCSRPTYRVAAVSRYGSYWFSEEVTAPDMVPDPPKMLQVDNIHHDSDMLSFVITLSWLNPRGWSLEALREDSPYSWQPYVQCPSSVTVVPKVFEDKHNFSNFNNSLKFHVADFVVGCKIIYAVVTHSKCSEDLVSGRAYLTIDLSCQSVEDFYSGEYCTPPPFNPPGNVKNTQITVFPGMHGARAHVTWSPPTDLGSAGLVDFYIVFYGFIRQDFGFTTFMDDCHNITMPGSVLQADVPIPQGTSSGEKFGILVMAGAPGQAIQHPIGLVNEVRATMSDGKVLLDEDIVVYQLEETREVRIYWSAPPSSDNATGMALQWGPVNPLHLDVISDASDEETRYNVTDSLVEFNAVNTAVVEKESVEESRD